MHTRFLLPLVLVPGLLLPVGAEPTVPGLHGDHPLDERQAGEVLIAELRCASCHEGISEAYMKAAPDLRSVGQRVTADYLQRFIADPAKAHEGTTMPAMLGGLGEEERAKVSADMAAYLRSLSGEREGPVDEAPEAGKGHELFHSVGCVACHNPRDEEGKELSRDGAMSLAHLPGKYKPHGLADFLHQPRKIRPSGRMPDMKLTRDEAAALALYLGGEGVEEEAPAVEPDQVAAGRASFVANNCTACHQVEDEPVPLANPGPALTELDVNAGCLSVKPGAAPDFHLTLDQRKAIRVALQAPKVQPDPNRELQKRLTQLNCIACHERDDYGGVAQDLDAYFHSTEEALGNEARIPPPLTLAGAKLRPAWMNKVLYDGESIRPYMTTRMPQFGTEALAGLTDLFDTLDHLPEKELAPPTREENPNMRNGAHLLLGDKGLNCIACHNYNGKESPGMKGLDLMTSYQRLKPAWFYEYMLNPGKFRPGIIMPSYWPDGKALQTEILEGDTERQLRALWYNFSLGQSARDPSGLRSEDLTLEVTDEVRTYRGRSNVAGYRGIAVGFPEDWNYAFNAQTGALSALWKGGFVTAGWRGQGPGNFNPKERAVQLPQDVGFLQLEDESAPWPLHPVRTKETPENPDPTYPWQHGYEFTGYSFDDEWIPTFTYNCGEVMIADRSAVSGEGDDQVLRRTLTFTAPSATTVHLRPLAGTIESVGSNSFQTKQVRLTVPTGAPTVRTSAAPDAESELLIKYVLPQGETTHVIDYALLP